MEDEFEPSCLGTKEHWDCAYEAELLNFVSSQEEGEIWFGEKVQNETVNYIVKHIEDRSTCIMDIGCGNGMFLIQLASKGSFSNLKGFDYSQKAVQLARSVAENRQATAVDFFLGDFLSDEFDHKCQIAIDKGTYDAISLMPTADGAPCSVKQAPDFYRQVYKRTVLNCIEKVSSSSSSHHKNSPFQFLITSCNWTEDELCQFFQPEFIKVDTIKRKAFSFGGSTGQTFSTVVFRKV